MWPNPVQPMGSTSVFADDQPPNFITLDAVRGIYEWCFHNGWVDEQVNSALKPSYSSAAPSEPPTEEQIRQDYDVRSQDSPQVKWPYGDLMVSVFAMGDFGRYINGVRDAPFHPIPAGLGFSF